MRIAASRPSSKRLTASRTAWSTSVGARMAPSSSPTLIFLRALRASSALRVEVDIRCRSSNQAIWSSVAPGMNAWVKTRQTGAPAGSAAVERQPGDACRVAGRIGQRQRAVAGHPHQREAVQVLRRDDRVQVAHMRLQREVVDAPIREAVAAEVVSDQGGEGAQLFQKVPP